MRKKRWLIWLRIAVSYLIAWFLIDGWSYVLFGIGLITQNATLTKIGGGWLTILYLPFTAEKVIVIPLAIFFHSKIFPKDKAVVRWAKWKFKEWNEARKETEKVNKTYREVKRKWKKENKK